MKVVRESESVSSKRTSPRKPLAVNHNDKMMVVESLHRRSLLWIVGGLLALGYALFSTYQAFPLRAPHPAADNFGLAWSIIAPIAVFGGLLIAHGVYRRRRNQHALWDVLVYPLGAGIAVSLPGVYVAVNPYYPSWSGIVTLQLLAFAIVAGGIIAGFIRTFDRWRGRPLANAAG